MITTLWFVFQLREGDILNCCIATTERQQAVERLTEVAESNLDDDSTWYRLTRIYYGGPLNSGTKLHLAVALDPIAGVTESLDLVHVVDQFEMLPQDVRDDENEKYWVDDVVVS